jgi:hypothetical protein
LTKPPWTVPLPRGGAQPFRPLFPRLVPRAQGAKRGWDSQLVLAWPVTMSPAPVCDQTPVFLFPAQANGHVSTGRETCSTGGGPTTIPRGLFRCRQLLIELLGLGFLSSHSTSEAPWTPRRPVMWCELKPTRKGCSGECLNPKRLSQSSSSSTWVDTASFQTNSHS